MTSLAALQRYEVLDTPPEPAFDRVTRLASQIIGTPIALEADRLQAAPGRDRPRDQEVIAARETVCPFVRFVCNGMMCRRKTR